MVHVFFVLVLVLSYALRNKGKQLQTIPFFLLFLFSALRYMYGSDYARYYYLHGTIHQGAVSPYDEFLFTKLSELIPSFFLLVALTSLVYMYVIYWLMKRELTGRGMFLGLLIFLVNPYLYLVNLSAMRQCLAMLCFIVAVQYGIRRKFLPYALWVVIAFLFHKSAILLLPVYFLLSEKPFKTKYVVLVACAVFAALWLVDIRGITRFVASWFNDPNYIAHIDVLEGNTLRATLLTAIGFVYILTNMPKLRGREVVYGKLYLISLIMGVLAYRLSMLTRFQMYFDIFSLVAIPTIMERDRLEGPIRVDLANKQQTIWRCINRYVLPTLIFVIYFLRYYSFFTNPMWSAFFTYQTIFSSW